MADRGVRLDRLSRLVRLLSALLREGGTGPSSFAHAVQIISWVNESQSENGFGMHQWDLFADSRHHFMMAHRGGRVVDVTEALSSTARVEVMLKEHVWQQASIPLAQCAALRRARKCVMEVVLTRLSKEGTS